MSSADDKFAVRIGKNVSINVDNFTLGDGVLIRDNVVIEGPEVSIGDYTVIGSGVEISGRSPCLIGMSCWIGARTMIDSSGSVSIGNGVGLATSSQLWTHMRFGDTLQGCRFEWNRDLVIEDDVYVGGNSLLGPIHAGRRSAALLGSVVTSDMYENRVYAGVPAVDITHKVGHHFSDVDVDTKFRTMVDKLEEFKAQRPGIQDIEIVKDWPNEKDPNVSYFNVSTREYTKRLAPSEVDFMLFLLTPIKFYPAKQ